MKRIISIDYGRARIGIAMTDVMQTLALPFKCIKTSKNFHLTIQSMLEVLSPYLTEAEKIVIGLPLLLDGTKGEMALEVEKFTEQLKKRVDIPIVLWDERLTSSQAEKELKNLKLSRKKRAENSDVMAATIILESYLNSQN